MAPGVPVEGDPGDGPDGPGGSGSLAQFIGVFA